jgi:hypothetical protein
VTQPPVSPPPPGSQPLPEPPPWSGYVPPHYVAPRRGMSSGAKRGLVALVLLLAGGGYAYLSWARPREIFSSVDERLGKLTCPASAPLALEMVFTDRKVDAFFPDARPELQECLRPALAGLKYNARRVGEVLTLEATIDVGPDGHPRLAESPRRLVRLQADWKVGVLGDHVASSRGFIADQLEPLLADGTECYVEFRARLTGRVPQLAWHTDDRFQVRALLFPDGHLGTTTVSRGDDNLPKDWSSYPGFGRCLADLFEGVAWPGHDGPREEWLNTHFTMGLADHFNQ